METIDELFGHLEECYVFALIARPPFTIEQMIDKAPIAIQWTRFMS